MANTRNAGNDRSGKERPRQGQDNLGTQKKSKNMDKQDIKNLRNQGNPSRGSSDQKSSGLEGGKENVQNQSGLSQPGERSREHGHQQEESSGRDAGLDR